MFRASSEPNQLGKPDSCGCWISGINNAIRPLLMDAVPVPVII